MERERCRVTASLKRVGDDGTPDPRISFNLELIGYEKFQDGRVAKDWFDVRIWLEVFGHTLEFPGQKTISIHDVKAFIKWLRELSKSSGPIEPFRTFYEPLFRMGAVPSAGETFDITALISSYGAADGFFSEGEGVSVAFSTNEASITGFADELERELRGVQE